MSTAGGVAEILRLAEADPRRTVTLATTVVSGLHYVVTFTRRAWVLPARSS